MTPDEQRQPWECVVCGFPVWRRDGHAEWCADVAALNATIQQLSGSGDWATARWAS